ncbi:deoxyribodipyrimidine photo-lyase [Conexibacter sp. S30A1]|uniref:cryptochrome/photolyase family protein n=1 Tax=Conexibacter sp. S30A1 TaxID=2937800 RepID=UPI00200DA76F|nr:deoxyribodipyrimidine photo-lyase [Conexibacter sp. S30A1]
MTAIVWFRRDLRLHDNPTLTRALAEHELVVPVFCLDERLITGRHRSAPRAAFMRGCLVELDRNLRAAGSRLVFVDRPPERAIPDLARQLAAEAVYAAADVSPFARRRDRAVAHALAAGGSSLTLGPGTFVADDLAAVTSGSGTPYTVFTPFYRRWLTLPRRAVHPAPRSLPAPPPTPASGPLPELGDLPPQAPFAPGEHAARERMLAFAAGEGLDGYHEHHDDLGQPHASGLSAYLHFGCVSARELESLLPDSDDAEAARRQLCWRDFYAHVLLHHPGNARAEQQPQLRGRIEWNRSMPLFDTWREGRTGYPLVDAAMRELLHTGHMHNRARLVVGSFLVKDMGIDWRWGERWFMRTLLDGDEANNNGNWQWIASVGVDPQPPSRRMFNPTLQQLKFDPEGHYVRRHVPELRSVPDAYLAEPWTMPADVQRHAGCIIGADYPVPVLDHAQARREAIARYERARSG